jgi:hypothetical protein
MRAARIGALVDARAARIGALVDARSQDRRARRCARHLDS